MPMMRQIESDQSIPMVLSLIKVVTQHELLGYIKRSFEMVRKLLGQDSRTRGNDVFFCKKNRGFYD